MARIFVTGSADGLGLLAANRLVEQGHNVVLHARNEERATHAKERIPGAELVLAADLSSIEATKILASQANATGGFDAVIHNAAVYRVPPNSVGAEGLSLMLTVNTLAPYILTCLMTKPRRLIYMTSGMHAQGDSSLKGLTGKSIDVNYSDTKLHDLILSMAVARKWSDVYSNAVNPGWVPTKMGGAGAPDDLEKGVETQVWLAVSNDAEAKVSGHYFFHKKKKEGLTLSKDVAIQERLIELCKNFTGVSFGG